MRSKAKQAHSHDPSQLALGEPLHQTKAVARRGDPQTSHDAAASVRNLRSSHLYVLQLFRTYGAMSDSQAWEAHQRLASDRERHVPTLSPSGLRSRRAELCPPRGAGIKDSGRKTTTAFGKGSIIWEIDPAVPDPFAQRSSKKAGL